LSGCAVDVYETKSHYKLILIVISTEEKKTCFDIYMHYKQIFLFQILLVNGGHMYLKRMLLGSWQKPSSQTCSRSFKIRDPLRQ